MNKNFIVYCGTVTSIRDKSDKDYVYFDIGNYETYTKKDGTTKISPSFFSARIPKFYTNVVNLTINMEVKVKGIPKGYVDKKGFRQNYIHVTEINGVYINNILKDKYYRDNDGNEYWDGELIPDPEPWDMNDPETKELSDWLDSFN